MEGIVYSVRCLCARVMLMLQKKKPKRREEKEGSSGVVQRTFYRQQMIGFKTQPSTAHGEPGNLTSHLWSFVPSLPLG